MWEPTSLPTREEKGLANNNLVEGTQVCVSVPARARTPCLNPCPSSKPLSSFRSSNQSQKSWDKVLFSTLTISFWSPQTQGGLNGYTLPHLLPTSRQIWDAAWWRKFTGTSHLSHKCANAHFGAFAQFPLYIYDKGREGHGAEFRGTFCPLTNELLRKQNEQSRQCLSHLRNNRKMNSKAAKNKHMGTVVKTEHKIRVHFCNMHARKETDQTRWKHLLVSQTDGKIKKQAGKRTIPVRPPLCPP